MESPTKQQLIHSEAINLLAIPPAPVSNPTDSFWAHFESSIDEASLERTDIHYNKISTVVIGRCYCRQALVPFCHLLLMLTEFSWLRTGGGLTGLSMAYWLTENGFSGDEILLIEARELGNGATGRNGGHCCPSTRVWSQEGMLYSLLLLLFS